MGRLRYAVIGLVLVIAAGIAVVVAGGTDPQQVAETPSAEEVLAQEPGDPAPPIDVEGWLNSDPLQPADLEGQVVVYDFWTYSCVNCIRTLPYLRAWYDRYHEDGLEIVGVHSPEFEFEKDHDNVAMAVEDNDITWPVAFDDEMATWDAFQNNYWPAKYVFDRDGRFRFSHFGEGAYEETEDILRALLEVDPDSPRADLSAEGVEGGEADDPGDSALPGCSPQAIFEGDEGCQTPETYLGSLRGAQTFGSPEPLEPGEATFTVPDDQRLHSAALDGAWLADPEAVTNVDDQGTISLRYEASEVNLVLAPPDSGPVDVVLELDGEPLAEADRGAEVTEDDQGRTVVTVDADDLYHLVQTDEPGVHTLTLRPVEPGVSAFAFTFGA